MSHAKPITKAQREAVMAHLREPETVTQAAVIKRLSLKNTNNFYRLATRIARELIQKHHV